MSDLKPCPFCGGDFQIYQSCAEDIKINGKDVFVIGYCNECFIEFTRYQDYETLVNNWENRFIEDTLRKQLEQAEAKLADAESELLAVENYQEELSVLRVRVKELEVCEDYLAQHWAQDDRDITEMEERIKELESANSDLMDDNEDYHNRNKQLLSLAYNPKGLKCQWENIVVFLMLVIFIILMAGIYQSL